MTDLRQALDAEEVVFGFEEVQNTMRSVLSFAASRYLLSCIAFRTYCISHVFVALAHCTLVICKASRVSLTTPRE